MHFNKKLPGTLLFCALCLLLPACGDNQGREWGLVRYVNVVSDEPILDFLRDADVIFDDVAFMEYTDYDRTEAKSYIFSTNVAEGYQELCHKSTGIAKDHNYSFIVVGTSYEGECVMLQNQTEKPSGGRTNIRFFNAGLVRSRVDVYVIPAGHAAGGLPVAENIAYKQTSNYVSGEAGQFYIRFNEAGTGNVLVESDVMDFKDGEVRTVILARGERRYGVVSLPDREH